MNYNEIFREFLTGNLKPIDELLKQPIKELKVFAAKNSFTFRSKKQFRNEIFTWLRIRKAIETDIISGNKH
jgi:hypothetical protein